MSEAGQARDEMITTLIRQLADYSTRASARRRLLQIGKPAVPALVEALSNPIEGVAWAAAVTLGQIGAEEAVEALERALSRPGIQDAAREALGRITGRDWSLAQPPQAGVTRAAKSRKAEVLSDEELASALASDTVSVEKSRGGHALNVLLPGGRRQNVQMLSLKDADGAALVAFYTECGPADAAKFEWALKTNLKIPFGAFAVREAAGGDRFVMVDAYLREGATVEQLKKAVATVARRADSFERELTGTDER
ncbi:MAG: HEAT repeat domain-containing protein [Planctomycetota bacterium]|jgi:hypothetical protein